MRQEGSITSHIRFNSDTHVSFNHQTHTTTRHTKYLRHTLARYFDIPSAVDDSGSHSKQNINMAINTVNCNEPCGIGMPVCARVGM